MEIRGFLFVVTTLFIIFPLAFSDDNVPIPKDKAQVNSWFQQNVKPLAARKGQLDPCLEAAEAVVKVIKVKHDGSGDFKTICDAVKSIPMNNKQRIIVHIGPGEYHEKIKMEREKQFVTFYGDPKAMPTLVFGGTAKEYGVVESGTLTVDGDYFVAANLHIKNSAPRPDGKMKLAQAAAMRIGGDKAAFYNVRFYGFQDTFCDDKGKHFFKDCYIEGTVDYIFGNGKSLYLNTELHSLSGDPQAWITAQARETASCDTGYVFVHSPVTGTGKHAMLGRAWRPFSKCIFAYCEMSDVVNPEGWNHNNHKDYDKNIFFGEFENTGPGANLAGRVPWVKKLTMNEVKPYISLAWIEGCKWLLPPPHV